MWENDHHESSVMETVASGIGVWGKRWMAGFPLRIRRARCCLPECCSHVAYAVFELFSGKDEALLFQFIAIHSRFSLASNNTIATTVLEILGRSRM